jgi:Class II flagellar assembly regulator
MRVSGTGTAAAAGVSQRSAQPAAGGFSPEAAEGARESSSTSASGAVGALTSLDALLALQETPGPTERKKRAVRRASGLLDALDQVKLALLDEGGDPRGALERLRAATRDFRDQTDDMGLEAVLDEVETRAAVELAKDEMAQRARLSQA